MNGLEKNWVVEVTYGIIYVKIYIVILGIFYGYIYMDINVGEKYV